MERAKWIVLVGLWVAWAVLIAIRWLVYQEPARMPLKFKSGQMLPRVEAATAQGIPPPPKRWSFPSGSLTVLTPKNIFAPLPQPPQVHKATQHKQVSVKAAPPAPVPVMDMPPPSPPPLPPPAPEEITAQQARQLMGQYRFLGYLTQNGESRAFLRKGQDLYIVRVGDAIEGQIHVAAIEATSLTVRDAVSQVESALHLAKEGGNP